MSSLPGAYTRRAVRPDDAGPAQGPGGHGPQARDRRIPEARALLAFLAGDRMTLWDVAGAFHFPVASLAIRRPMATTGRRTSRASRISGDDVRRDPTSPPWTQNGGSNTGFIAAVAERYGIAWTRARRAAAGAIPAAPPRKGFALSQPAGAHALENGGHSGKGGRVGVPESDVFQSGVDMNDA